MTAWDLLAIAWQRWYVTVAGALLTALGLLWVMGASPVYLSQVSVVLLPPAASALNGYSDTPRSLIHMAGVVARAIRGSGGDAQAVSENVTLVGEGYRDGYLVRHPNDGGQWDYSFDEPLLNIQAVGDSPAEAREAMDHALETVEDTIVRLQDAESVTPTDRVRTELVPAEPQLREFTGSLVRSLAATVVTGALVTLLALGALGPVQKDPRGHQRHRTRTSGSDADPAPGD